MSRIICIFILGLFLITNANAGSTGSTDLSKNSNGQNGQVKDCFEGINRGIFAFNQALDKIVVEPIAKGYLHLPSAIRSGTSNFLSNLTLLVSIPNNILQGQIISPS